MKAGTRLWHWFACAGLIAALPILGSVNVAAASGSPAAATPTSAHVSPFLTLTKGERSAVKKRPLRAAGSVPVTLRGRADAAGISTGRSAGAPHTLTPVPKPIHAPLITSTPPDDLSGFAGTAQASTIHSFGPDQEVTPPNEDIAVGAVDLVEVVNSTIEIFNRTGGVLGAADLNSFMDVSSGYHSSDPRAIYDVETGHFWVTVTEVPDSGCAPQPVLIAVSASSNPMPFTGWLVYALPFANSDVMFGDQPGLGADKDTVVVTFDDFDCSLEFVGSEVDILEKTDLEHDTGSNADDVYSLAQFAPQPVQAYTGFDLDYVVTNESDCGSTACPNPEVEVDSFQGTPETGGTYAQQYFVAIAPTAVNDTTGFLPPADQPSPGPRLQTNDDRFLNAVETQFGEIWTADGTSCEPSGDTVQRACLDYVDISVGGGTSPPTLGLQLNNVGVEGADLFYPAVAVDAAGDLMTVFDESSTTMDPSIMDAAIPSSGSSLSAFDSLHTSSTYYNGDDLFGGACDSEGCRWGDYSGAAEDPANPADVWVVSGSEDGSVEGLCTDAHACWNTRIDQLTVTPPMINSILPAYGPVVGGETVTAGGFDFAADTTFAAEVSPGVTLPIPVHILTPELLTFVTPSAASVGGTLDIETSDSLGPGGTANLYQYINLANYVSVTPFRVLDTRSGGGGALGPGAVRTLQITGLGSPPIPFAATAVVLNVTEINGTAASLLTVYPVVTTRPNASNLNFAAHTVIANLVTATLNDGMLNIYNALGTVNIVADVEGYFVPEPSGDYQGLFHPIAPVRVCDTRSTSHTPACRAHGALGPEVAMPVNVTGAGSGAIPGDGTAEAAVLNVTGVAGSGGTYLSVFPTNSSGGCTYTGSHAPPVSTLNLAAGAVAANRVMVELGPETTGGPDTSVCVYNSVGTINVVLDANGWFGSSTATATPAGYEYQALLTSRICDTRVASPACATGALGPGSSRLIEVDGNGLVPVAGSSTVVVAVIVNLTAVAPSQGTYLTLYPSDPGAVQTPPLASDLNVNAAENLPNLAVVQLDTAAGVHDGYISLFNSVGSVNAAIDLEGWFQ